MTNKESIPAGDPSASAEGMTSKENTPAGDLSASAEGMTSGIRYLPKTCLHQQKE